MKRLHPIVLSTLLPLLLLLASGTASAQDLDTTQFFGKIDNRLYRSQHRAKIDTAYIAIPENRWTLGTAFFLSRNYFDAYVAQGAAEGDNVVGSEKVLHLNLQSALTAAPSVSVAWRGLTIGASINPAWFFKQLKNEDQSYGISVYGNRFGMAAGIRSMTTLKGYVMQLPDSLRIGSVPAQNCFDISADFDGYYAINGSRFSMPAAFNRSQIQKRTAGSPMITLSIRNKYTKMGRETRVVVDSLAMFYNIVCAGGGYGQNWVTRHNWLIHVSGLLNMSLFEYNMEWLNGKETRFMAPFSDFVATTRFSVTRFMPNHYYGVDVIWRTAAYNIWSKLISSTSYVDAHFVFGWRF